MFQRLYEIYSYEGYEIAMAWYQGLSEEEQEQLQSEMRSVAVGLENVFESLMQRISKTVLSAIKTLQPLIDAYIETNPKEFERLARKERSYRRYERLAKKHRKEIR